MRRFLPFLLLLAALPARAQTTTVQMPAPGASVEDSVRMVVDRLFDGMRTGNADMLLSTLHPKARLMSTGRTRDGRFVVREDTIAAFARQVGTPHPEVYDERLSNVEVRVDGPLAMVWAPYHFYVGTTFSHCGVNSFQLIRTDTGWQILQITDTRRRTGCTP